MLNKSPPEIIPENDLLAILDTITQKTLAFGADEVEVYCETYRIAQCTLEKNDLQLAKDGLMGGIGVRVFKNKAVAFACGNSITKEEGLKIAEKAVKLARKLPSAPYNYLPLKEAIKPVMDIYDADSTNFTTEEVLERTIQLLKAVKDKDSRVMIDSGTFSASYGLRGLVNSNGVAASEYANAFSWYLAGMPRENGQVGNMTIDYDFTIHQDQIDVIKTAERFVPTCLSTLGAKKLDHQFNGNVIFSPKSVIETIVPLVLFNCSAEHVQKGYSCFQSKLEQVVMSEQLTFVDDGSLKGKINSSAFDREGVPHQRLGLIEKGILKSFYYDSIAANHENRKSTGHAVGGWNSPPQLGPTNLMISAGSVSLAELQESPNTIIIESFVGDPDPITGDASLVIKNGSIYQNGKNVPIREATLNVNMFELLRNIQAISKEQSELFSYILPSICFGNINIIS